VHFDVQRTALPLLSEEDPLGEHAFEQRQLLGARLLALAGRQARMRVNAVNRAARRSQDPPPTAVDTSEHSPHKRIVDMILLLEALDREKYHSLASQ